MTGQKVKIITKPPINLWEFAKRVSPCRCAAYLQWWDATNTPSPSVQRAASKAAARRYPNVQPWEIPCFEKEILERHAERLRLRAKFLIGFDLPHKVRNALRSGKHTIRGRKNGEGEHTVLTLSDLAGASVDLHYNCLNSPPNTYEDISIDFDARPSIETWAGKSIQRIIHDLACHFLEEDKPKQNRGWQAQIHKKISASYGLQDIDDSTVRKYAKDALDDYKRKMNASI